MAVVNVVSVSQLPLSVVTRRGARRLSVVLVVLNNLPLDSRRAVRALSCAPGRLQSAAQTAPVHDAIEPRNACRLAVRNRLQDSRGQCSGRSCPGAVSRSSSFPRYPRGQCDNVPVLRYHPHVFQVAEVLATKTAHGDVDVVCLCSWLFRPIGQWRATEAAEVPSSMALKGILVHAPYLGGRLIW